MNTCTYDAYLRVFTCNSPALYLLTLPATTAAECNKINTIKPQLGCLFEPVCMTMAMAMLLVWLRQVFSCCLCRKEVKLHKHDPLRKLK